MIKQSTLVTFMAAAGIALLGAQAAHADIVKVDGSSTVHQPEKHLPQASHRC